VVTNINPEHMEFYGDFDAVRDAYRTFLENLPFYGFAALCLDHAEVQALVGRVSDRRIVTYGMSPQAEVRAFDVRTDALGSLFSVEFSDRQSGTSRLLEDLRLPMLGAHNVQNALAAIAVGREMELSDDTIHTALGGFKGVKRRFTKTGVIDGITIIDDYGHHPVEISAVLKSARDAYDGRIIAVVQPHRYTRLRDLFEDFCTCFNNADAVIVAPVHAAGEAPIDGFDRDSLVEGLRTRGHRQVTALDAPEQLVEIVGALAEPGDMVVCLGAGTITNWANALPDALAKWRHASPAAANDHAHRGGAS
jgi:UDP-N-acetylmuramate--alanine ligase